MNPSPVNFDTRTILEAISGTLAFVLAGIAAVHLGPPFDILIPLSVGALIVLINRLLGKNATDAVAELRAVVSNQLIRTSVLESAATPATIRKADAAIAPAAVIPPSTTTTLTATNSNAPPPKATP